MDLKIYLTLFVITLIFTFKIYINFIKKMTYLWSKDSKVHDEFVKLIKNHNIDETDAKKIKKRDWKTSNEIKEHIKYIDHSCTDEKFEEKTKKSRRESEKKDEKIFINLGILLLVLYIALFVFLKWLSSDMAKEFKIDKFLLFISFISIALIIYYSKLKSMISDSIEMAKTNRIYQAHDTLNSYVLEKYKKEEKRKQNGNTPNFLYLKIISLLKFRVEQIKPIKPIKPIKIVRTVRTVRRKL